MADTSRRGPNRTTAIIKGQFTKATKDPHESLKFLIDESDIKIWYILLNNMCGENNEFLDGEYLLRVKIPDTWVDCPSTPPDFYFMTPNGLYGCETIVCVSIGKFHPDQYRATLGIIGFCANLISGLIGWKEIGHGIQILDTTLGQKKALAKRSRLYNMKNHSEILKKIHESFRDYSSRWDISKIPAEIKIKLGICDNKEKEKETQIQNQTDDNVSDEEIAKLMDAFQAVKVT